MILESEPHTHKSFFYNLIMFLPMILDALRTHILKLSQKTLVRNTLWMLTSRGIELVIQAAFFVVIARTLGVDDYGAFVGIEAFVFIFYPFSGLGRSKLLIKNASRNPALFNEYWGNALFASITSGIGLTLLAIFIGYALLPIEVSPLVLPLLAAANLIFSSIFNDAIDALLSQELVHWMAKLGLIFRLGSLLAALCLSSFFEQPGVVVWAALYFAVTVFTGIGAVIAVCRIVGRPKLILSRIKPELVEGLYFAVGASSANVYNNIDKSMLACMSTLEATGIYGAAYRLVTVAFTPVFSLLASAYARFFQKGKEGIKGSLKLAQRLLPITALYGIAASVGLIVLAPVVPLILGNEYSTSVDALRWLSPLIFLKSIHYFAADTLTGAGLQGLRTATQVFVALFNILGNLWLIPLYSWKGAVWSSLASDGSLLIVLWALVFIMAKRQRNLVVQDRAYEN